MNVFVLNAGRCGSTTFIRACSHIENYSAGHESRVHMTGDRRLAYADHHIEADNRLGWILGRLDKAFGPDAFYVHLQRERQASIDSFSQRADFGIMKAYREGILLLDEQQPQPSIKQIAADYLLTMDANIRLFLRDKPRKMQFHLESAEQDFLQFWKAIGAIGDYRTALAEWRTRYNAS